MKTTLIGQRILQLLKERGETQCWLAREIGTDASAMNRWIKGKGNPTIKSIEKMEKVLNSEIITVL